MKHWILYCKTLLAICVFIPLQASAYNVSPSIVTLYSIGSASSTFFRIDNRGPKPTAVEFQILEHSKDIHGKPIKGEDAGDDFVIYPSQVVLMPGDEASVQVLWIGDPHMERERAYTFLAREVAIPKDASEQAGNESGMRLDITVLMNYEGRVYVTPPGTKPNLVLEAVNQNPVVESPSMIEVIVANHGSAHKSLINISLIFEPLDANGTVLKDKTISLASSEVPAMRAHLLAGSKRRLLIPRPAGLPLGKVNLLLSE